MADPYARAQEALSFINADCDRETWYLVGMAIQDEFGEEGWPLWDAWSAEAPSYKTAEARAVWKSFKPGKGKGFGYVVNLAKENGFDPRGKGAPITPEAIEQRNVKNAERKKVHEAEEAVEAAEAAVKAQERWAAASPASPDHPYLKKKGIKPHGLRVGKWPKLDPMTGKVLQLENVLLLPIMNRKREIQSLQGITTTGDKIYLYGGSKHGNFYVLGAPVMVDGAPVFHFAEGFATAASAHEATGHMTLCCYDAGNLVEVVRAVRASQPAARLVILADNDTETEAAGKGNTGMRKATQVALETGAYVAHVPEGGDFNDLRLAQGDAALVARVEAAAIPTAPYPEKKPPAAEKKAAKPKAAASGAVTVQLDTGAQPLFHKYFEMLGYDQKKYFLFDRRKKQVDSITVRDINDATLFELAPREFWEMNYSATREGGAKFDKVVAMEDMLARARARGVYSGDVVREHGVWRDAGRVVFHHGDVLTVDGQLTEVDEIRSAFVYPMKARKPRPADVAMTEAEGRGLYETARLMRWSKQGSAALLMGWIFLSPICGALPWRPHVWLNGPSGSGKSHIQNYFVAPLIAGFGESLDGGTSTEAGIRQRVGSSSVPVTIDEFEPVEEKSRAAMEAILALIRQSSSESLAITAKGSTGGTAATFHVRSMFFLSSINSLLNKDSDNSRITQIVLKASNDEGPDNWGKLQDALHLIETDPEISRRLLRRSIDAIPMIDEHRRTFTRIGAAKFGGSQRHGDQFGTLLCGFWFLTHDAPPTEAQVEKIFGDLDWTEHQESGPSDHVATVNEILAKTVHVSSDHGSISVFELLQDADWEIQSHTNTTRFGPKIARQLLERHGMKMVEHEAEWWVAFNPQSTALKKMVKDLPAFADLRGTLKRAPNATTFGKRTFRNLGSVVKAVGLRVDQLLGKLDEQPPAGEIDESPPL